MKKSRNKFTTTLTPDVIEKLGIMKVINKKRGLNEIIEELVNDKYDKEMGIMLNDKNSKKREELK